VETKPAATWGWKTLCLAAALVLPACASGAPAGDGHDHEHVGEAQSAVFTNGDFESGTNNQPPPSWTVSTYLNPNPNGVTIQTPQTRAGLNLATGGVARTYTLLTAAGPESQADPTLGTAASLRWPKFGNACAIVNQQGNNNNVNGMTQTMTISSADIDPNDGLAHVRLVLAPVLQDPGHLPNQQPYFFIQLTNITKGNAVVYSDFNFANQTGVPWKQNAAGTVKYTDWALVDIAPGSAQMGPGDQVMLEIIGAGCSLGGHWGQVYVDGIGPSVPGLFVSATGPAQANQNTDITYTLNYKNGGSTAAGGVFVDFNTPPNTTFTSFSAPGLTCTAPAMGATGLVHCTIGTLPAGGTGSFTITVHINNGTAGSVITAGNYDIYGTGISPLIGPKVYTTVTNGVTYADLSVTKTDGVTSVAAGSMVTYTIVVNNAGPNAVSGATVADPLPAVLTGASWTCVGSGGATCTASGTGSVNDSATSIPVGGKLTYTVTATVNPAAPAGQLANVATATVPAGAVDPGVVNNSAADYDQITVANGVACVGNVECTSGVCDPTDNKCGYANGDGPCTTGNGGSICRSGVCSANGGVCIPAGGCFVDADCAAGNWCNNATFTCTPKLANGTQIPTVPGHNPALGGTCTAAAGAAVCQSAVCDTNDNLCGYANGDGPCNTANGGTVCRSGMCSPNGGVCIPTGGCFVDADCTAGNWCNTSTFTCTPKLPNGQQIPTVSGHNPPLTGTCTAGAGAAVCLSAVCDTNDNLCGFANGDGPCDMASAGTVCRSGACSVNNTCMPAGGCNVDADCASTAWCNISAHTCTPKVANGGVIPTDPGHASPVIDGTCSAPAATVVCVSAVCDTADNRCGYANGDGTCDATNGGTVCRSDVCDTKDGKCGYLNGDGPCTLAEGPVVCRSGACSPNGGVCMPVGGCAVDADCGASEWCNTESFTCKPKLPNGQPIPTVAGHNPALAGTCTAGAGAAVCDSGVCDTADNLCGYADGDGPCTSQNGVVVCRSSTCSTSGVCEAAGACTTDADCDAVTQYCDTGAKLCAPKLPNGSPLPVVSGHTPAIDGVCDPAEAAVVCQSGVCDTKDNKCGFLNGDGPCTTTNAGTVCRSSTCSENGAVCVPSGGCAVDADCQSTQWCNTDLFACVLKLSNGAGIPTVNGHTPALTGTCTTGAGAAVCQSGVCDTNDNKCGYANGDGPCTTADAGVVCREGACSTTGVCEAPKNCTVDADCDTTYQYCNTGAGKCAPKLPNGALLPGVAGHMPPLDGTCTPQAAQIVCQSGVCDPEDGKCGHAIGKGPCDSTNGATVCRSTICAVSGANMGLCVECVADTQCAGAKPVCDTGTNFCVQCTPAEDAACAGTTPVCVTGPDTCAPCDGDLGSNSVRACTDSNAPYCFLSGPQAGACGKCTSDADCQGHPGGDTCDTQSGACTKSGCHSDADCAATDWCNAPSGGVGACVPKLDNGQHLPASPSTVATCSTAVGKRVCKSGVCDTKDDTCGLLNGDGPCNDGTVCRSGACDSKDKVCGYADGDGPCTSNDVCRNGHCDTATQLCGQPATMCKVDSECKTREYCATDGTCQPTKPDGQACMGDHECQSGSCHDSKCDSILASGNGVICAAGPSDRSDGGAGAALVGLVLAAAGLARRRRR
jgi:uncharacterized repeat protein (TIGR01451 family)